MNYLVSFKNFSRQDYQKLILVALENTRYKMTSDNLKI